MLFHGVRHRETSVGEDVYEHVRSLGVISEEGIGGLQLRMPCQAASLQQWDCLLIDHLNYLQQCITLS